MDIKGLKVKDVDIYSMIISGILYLGLGILFLTQKDTVRFAIKSTLNLLVIFFAITAIFQVIGFAPIKKKGFTSISRLFGFITNLMLASIIYFNPKLVISIFPIFFGMYAFFWREYP